jgi:hypothetical protein
VQLLDLLGYDAVSQSAGDFALKELFTHGKSQHFRRMLLGVLAQCFQQISGIKWVSMRKPLIKGCRS